MDILDPNLNFEDRFVAFIDILGFKAFIEQLEASGAQDDLKKIKSILNFMQEETVESHYQTDLPVYEMKDGMMYEKELGDPRMLYVSDCMIISATGDANGFKILSNKIHKIITELAVDGLFCRGAISKGKLFHHGEVLFGSAYMKAYALEAKAVFPRVILDPGILSFFDVSDGKMPLAPAFYGLDHDGYYYLKYFTWQYFPPYLTDWIHYLLVVRKHIIGYLDAHYPDMCPGNSEQKERSKKLLEKYIWLGEEFNRNFDFYATYLLRAVTEERQKIIDSYTKDGVLRQPSIVKQWIEDRNLSKIDLAEYCQ